MEFSITVHNGERNESVALYGALSHAENQPDFVLKPEYTRVEYALNNEFGAARPDVPGSDDWVLWKTLCHLVD
jgi:hypothetical protein